MLTLYGALRSLPQILRTRFVKDESGQTMVEYVLMVVLIALVVILAIPAVTTAISNAFTNIANALK